MDSKMDSVNSNRRKHLCGVWKRIVVNLFSEKKNDKILFLSAIKYKVFIPIILIVEKLESSLKNSFQKENM